MQNFFFDRRSRKRNRRSESDVPVDQDRRQTDRRNTERSTLEHYYAANGLEDDDLKDLQTIDLREKALAARKGQLKPGS
ncbi:MAG: hypothetical protein RBS88_02730 [Spongiibacteraceae bacterium]|nr:hypothetical protein [Spongiibacteraceae bacterium]